MAKKLGKSILKYFVYGGITEEEYNANKDAIMQRNMETLPAASAVTSLMFAGLLLSSLFSNSIGKSQSYYVIMLILSVFVLIMSLTVVKMKPPIVIFMWYLLFLAFGLYGIFLNTLIRPELSATTICVFVVAGPLLIIDRPVRIIGFMMGLSALFVVCAVNAKTQYLAFADSVNLICCLLMGITIYITLNRVRLREIVQASQLRYERDTDRLTGLLNKAAAEEIIRRQLKSLPGKGALIVMDIDDFKTINDTYGHAYGDVILNITAGCIISVFGEIGTCSRFGGDEFVIYLPEISEPDLSAMLDSLKENLKSGIVLPSQDMHVNVSVGAAFSMRHGNNYRDLFQSADTALYAAKKAGKNRYMIY